MTDRKSCDSRSLYSHPRRERKLTKKDLKGSLANLIFTPIMMGVVTGFIAFLAMDLVTDSVISGIDANLVMLLRAFVGLAITLIGVRFSVFVLLTILKRTPSMRSALLEFWSDENGEPMPEEVVPFPTEHEKERFQTRFVWQPLLLIAFVNIIPFAIADAFYVKFQPTLSDILDPIIVDCLTVVLLVVTIIIGCYLTYCILRSSLGGPLKYVMADAEKKQDTYEQAH